MSITVGVVGLGLIGASFCKAYKESGARVYGWNRTRSTAQMAKMQGIIDDYLTDDNLGTCDLVIVSLYPEASVEWMRTHKDNFNKAGIVIDACGTKKYVCEEGFKIAKEAGFTFVGCHPMAGLQYSGMAYAKADLYVGAPMVVVPPVFDDINLLDRVKNLLIPCKFGSFHVAHAEQHDRMISFTSQMPHVISNAYIKSPNAREHKGFSGGSYKDLTRVASLNPTMWTELFFENKDNLIFEIENLQNELQKYKEALINDDHKKMYDLLEEGSRIKDEVDGK